MKKKTKNTINEKDAMTKNTIDSELTQYYLIPLFYPFPLVVDGMEVVYKQARGVLLVYDSLAKAQADFPGTNPIAFGVRK